MAIQAVPQTTLAEYAIERIVKPIPWETSLGSVARSMISGDQRMKSLQINIPFTVPRGANTTVVDPAIGPSTLNDAEEYMISTSMNLYLDDMISVTGEIGLFGAVTDADEGSVRAIRSITNACRQTRQELVSNMALYRDTATSEGIPAANDLWTFATNTRGGTNLQFRPQTDNLVRLGGTANVRTTRDTVIAGDTLTSLAFLNDAWEILSDRGAQPIEMFQGEQIFNMYVPYNVLKTIRNLTGYNTNLINYTVGGATPGIVTGTIPVLNGFRIIPVPTSTATISGQGSGGVDIYGILFAGEGAIIKAALPVSELAMPRTGMFVESAPIDDITSLRITPQGDGFGDNLNVGAKFYTDYIVRQPEATYRMEVGNG